MSNIDLQVEVLGDDLKRLQDSLSLYEGMLLKKESVHYVKDMIDYYREESKIVRSALLALLRSPNGTGHACASSSPEPRKWVTRSLSRDADVDTCKEPCKEDPRLEDTEVCEQEAPEAPEEVKTEGTI